VCTCAILEKEKKKEELRGKEFLLQGAILNCPSVSPLLFPLFFRVSFLLLYRDQIARPREKGLRPTTP